MRKYNLVRLCVVLVIAGIHAALLFVTFHIQTTQVVPEVPATVMKLTNFDEEIPLPPPPPPPVEVPPMYQNTIESVADVMQETEEEIMDVVISTEPIQNPVIQVQEEYLPMHRISVPPSFSETELRQRLVYPTIAQKSGIEGIVYLELFIDRAGNVQNIVILKEDPIGRGFGEAAIRAFQGFHGTPAHANGNAVAVRYRYPLRFVIR
jgi:protein TonB